MPAFFLAAALLGCPALLPSAAVAGQTITINGNVNHDIFGNGDASNSGYWDWLDTADLNSPDNNTVIVNSGVTVDGRIFGEYAESDTATANNNSVTITGGTQPLNSVILGGYASGVAGGTATGNRVTISGGSAGDVTGGAADTYSDSPTGTGNTISGPATVTSNTVTITDSTVARVWGGSAATEAYADSGAGDVVSGSVKADNNSVVITGGTVGNIVFGGRAASAANAVTGADGNAISSSAQANGNSVTINGNAQGNTTVYGGWAYNYTFADSGSATSGSTSAVGNNVFIGDNAHVGGDVYGGLAWNDGAAGSATATDNTVTISGSPTFGANTVLYGGLIEGLGAGDAFTGNTLNLHSSNLTVGGLQNFQFLNFYLPADLGNGGTMLTVTNTAQLSENADGSGRQATVNVGIDGASTPLKTGEKVILIDAGTLIGSSANTISKAEGMQGVTLEYTFDITTVDDQLLATVASVGANEQSRSLSEGFLAGPALVNQTGDLATGKGIGKAVEAAGGKTPGKAGRAAYSPGSGLGVFGTVAGGWNRYNTGSNVDLSSVSLLAGMSMGNDLPPGRLTLGAFVEYGNGSYDTYNSFAGAPDPRGKGDIDHLGGGVIGRLDFNQGLYTEASLRAGKVSNDYKNGNLNGRAVKYETDSSYYSLHAGLGYVWNLSEKSALDLYGKYFWTRQNGDTQRLTSGETLRFDDVDSHRLRVGGRFVYAASDVISPYAGLAYEHEFDGDAKATTQGYAIAAPSLHGGTGIGEIGLAIKASQSIAAVGRSGCAGLCRHAGRRDRQFAGEVRVLMPLPLPRRRSRRPLKEGPWTWGLSGGDFTGTRSLLSPFGRVKTPSFSWQLQHMLFAMSYE